MKGKGFCLIDNKNNDIACNAFSACIGNGKLDIGIETKAEYREKMSKENMLNYLESYNKFIYNI